MDFTFLPRLAKGMGSLSLWPEEEAQSLRSRLSAFEKHAPRILLKTMLDAGASSFGKAFLLYALPMSVMRGELKKAILRRASALAAFMGMAKATQVFLCQLENAKLRHYSQAIAGGLGAALALVIDPGLGYNTLVIWFSIRAGRCLIEENKLGELLDIPHLPTAMMCLSASQILSCWVRYPSEVDPGYRRFLDFQGGRPAWAMRALAAPHVPIPYPIYLIRKPGASLLMESVFYFLAGLKRATKIYLPLYLAALAFGLLQPRNHTLSRIVKLLLNAAVNVMRSTAFLSAYCTIAWTSWPLLKLLLPSSYNRGATRVALCRHVWMAGLATLLERKERRPELAAYCTTYALDTLWRRLEKAHPAVNKIQPYIAGLLLIVSCSILLHHFEQQPALVTKWVLGFTPEDVDRPVAPVPDEDSEQAEESVQSL